MIAYIVNHRKTPNIIVTIIDTFSADNSCMSIIGNLRYSIVHIKLDPEKGAKTKQWIFSEI